MPYQVSEKALQQAVVSMAQALGWRHYHTFDSRRSVPGFPDLVLVKAPRILFIELKRKDGRISPAQREWLNDLKACPGIEVYVMRPEHWPAEVKRILHAAPGAGDVGPGWF